MSTSLLDVAVLERKASINSELEAIVLNLWRRRGEAGAVAKTTSELQSLLKDSAVLDAVEFYLPQLAHMLIQLGGASGDTWCHCSACGLDPAAGVWALAAARPARIFIQATRSRAARSSRSSCSRCARCLCTLRCSSSGSSTPRCRSTARRSPAPSGASTHGTPPQPPPPPRTHRRTPRRRQRSVLPNQPARALALVLTSQVRADAAEAGAGGLLWRECGQ